MATKRSLPLLATPVVSGDVAAADAVVPTDYLAFPLLFEAGLLPHKVCTRGLGEEGGGSAFLAGRPHTSVMVCHPLAGTAGS